MSGGIVGPSITLTIDGFAKLRRELMAADRKLRKRAIVKGLRRGAGLLVRASRADAPVGKTGLLKESIGSKISTDTDRGRGYAVIGVRRGHERKKPIKLRAAASARYGLRGRKADPIKYLHLVHDGTTHSRANPFLRRAFNLNWRRANAMMAQEAWRAITGG